MKLAMLDRRRELKGKNVLAKICQHSCEEYVMSDVHSARIRLLLDISGSTAEKRSFYITSMWTLWADSICSSTSIKISQKEHKEKILHYDMKAWESTSKEGDWELVQNPNNEFIVTVKPKSNN